MTHRPISPALYPSAHLGAQVEPRAEEEITDMTHRDPDSWFDRNKELRNFKVVAKGEGFRLMHVPSGDYIQRYLRDFDTRADAQLCARAIVEALPSWDWSDARLFRDMPADMFDRVWNAIYIYRHTDRVKL
jgi:hypothetical protein